MNLTDQSYLQVFNGTHPTWKEVDRAITSFKDGKAHYDIVVQVGNEFFKAKFAFDGENVVPLDDEMKRVFAKQQTRTIYRED